ESCPILYSIFTQRLHLEIHSCSPAASHCSPRDEKMAQGRSRRANHPTLTGALSLYEPVFNALHATWNHVHTTFKEALDLRRMYKQDMARHDCQNPQCSTSIALRDVKKIHWKSEHSTKSSYSLREGPPSDRHFVSHVIHRHFQAYHPSGEYAKDLASITDPEPCPVVCIFSYMTEERKKSVIPGHEFMAIPIHNIWDEEVWALLKTEKNGALCYAVLTDAEQSYFSVYEWVAT
ncbi:hypothetical protein C8J56DRAFT_1103170, partial [Mycena floridula]